MYKAMFRRTAEGGEPQAILIISVDRLGPGGHIVKHDRMEHALSKIMSNGLGWVAARTPTWKILHEAWAIAVGAGFEATYPCQNFSVEILLYGYSYNGGDPLPRWQVGGMINEPA